MSGNGLPTVTPAVAVRNRSQAEPMSPRLDRGLRIPARIGLCFVHDISVGNMVESSLNHAVDSVIRQSRDHRVIGDCCSLGYVSLLSHYTTL